MAIVRIRRGLASTALCTMLVASAALIGGLGSSVSASAASSPIKIGVVEALTGFFSPGSSSAVTAATARVDLANAGGGVKGHKVQLIVADDQSTGQGALTAVQSLVSKGVIGIVTSDTADTDGAAETYASKHHVPFVSIGQDPTEVSDPDFYSIAGVSGTSVPASTAFGVFLKSIGVTKMAGLAWGDVAVSVSLMQVPLEAATYAGVNTVLTDLSSGFATADYTPQALNIKGSSAQGVYAALTSGGTEAFATALQQQGVQLKGNIWVNTMYEGSVLQESDESALEGSYVWYNFAPISLHSSAANKYAEVLAKYAPGTFGGNWETILYLGTDLLIDGATHAKGAITAKSVAAAIHGIKSYTGEGLLPTPLNYSLAKTNPVNEEKCYYPLEILNKAYVPASKKAVCGSLVKVAS